MKVEFRWAFLLSVLILWCFGWNFSSSSRTQIIPCILNFDHHFWLHSTLLFYSTIPWRLSVVFAQFRIQKFIFNFNFILLIQIKSRSFSIRSIRNYNLWLCFLYLHQTPFSFYIQTPWWYDFLNLYQGILPNERPTIQFLMLCLL